MSSNFKLPSITVTDLPLIRSKIKVQATSFFDGNSQEDIIQLVPRPSSYTSPVTDCIGANAFVLDAFGIPGGTIQTPYSLYQFFEIFGVARQRSASEVGEALLSAIPDGAVVFFLDPSMSLSWKRPLSNEDRSVIVSRKAYGDAGIWNVATQSILHLNGGKIYSDDLLTTYDGYGTGANFTARFVYGWVTAADFISTYSAAAAEAFQESDLGEVNFGVLPSSKWVGRYHYSDSSTPAVYRIIPAPHIITLPKVRTRSEVVRYVQTHMELMTIKADGRATFSSSEGVLSLSRNSNGTYEAVILLGPGLISTISNVPGVSRIALGDGELQVDLLGGYTYTSPSFTMTKQPDGTILSQADGHYLVSNQTGIFIDGTTAEQDSLEGFAWWMESLGDAALEQIAEWAVKPQIDSLNLTVGALDALTFDIAVIIDGVGIEFETIVFGNSVSSNPWPTVQWQESAFDEIGHYFEGFGLDRSSVAYFMGGFLIPGAWEENLALGGARIIRGTKTIDLVNKYNKILGSFTPSEFETAAIETQRVLRGWSIPNSLPGHVKDHAREFGLTEWRDYVDLSQDFWKQAKTRGFEVKVDSNNIIRVYDSVTNTLGSYNPNFTTKTFFKPVKNGTKAQQLRYWAKEKWGELVTPWW